MSFPTKVIFISLLLVLLHAQAGHNIYELGGQQYQYIYGTGQHPNANLGDRPEVDNSHYVPDSTYVPPPVSKVSTVSCPANQVYNNILCECVCVLGYYMKNGHCHKFDPQNPICGRNEVYRDQRCQCDYGFFLIGTICDVCPPYSTYDINTLSCNCASGYVLVQG